MLKNRRATFDYEILETFEAGMVLKGSEVKSLRDGQGSIAEAYARLHNGEVWLENMNIPSYKQASYNNHEPLRRRKLLLQKNEISNLQKGLERKGLTLIPMKLYFQQGWVKLKLGLGRGKKMHDKRDSQAKKDAKRQMDKALKNYG